MTGQPFTEEQLVFLEPGPDRIGHIYRKAVYRSYTPGFGTVIDGPNEVLDPDTGQTRILRPPGSGRESLGLLGPMIRAEVGDTIIVHFRNETRFPVSVHPHGVFHNGNRIDVTEIFPAATKTMDMVPDDPGTWMYHCHVNDHLDAGMVTRFTILP